MSVKNSKPKKDKVTGVETTGHVWDGLEELNNPTPRWWIWLWVATIVFSIWYWVVYPAWPTITDHTVGKYNWTAHKELKSEQKGILEIRAKYLDEFQDTSFAEIKDKPDLYAFALAGGKSAFKDHCAACHGTGAAGAMGKYPNLNDDDWLWGGSVDNIYTTIKYGVRSTHDDSHISDMPAFGQDNLLTGSQITNVVSHVLSLSDRSEPDAKGAKIFAENCASCHADDGTGGQEFGAPNLADAIWLYGGDRTAVTATVIKARGGVMPHWEGRLSEDTIRQLALYVHSLGGGE